MKLAKYIIAILVVLTLLLVIANFYRDSIAKKVANSALRGQDITILDVSVDSIGTSDVRFAALELELASGARIRVSGVSLPLDVRNRRSGPILIGEIELLLAEGDNTRPPISEMLDAWLKVPVTAPDIAVEVSRFSVATLVEATNLSWHSTNTGQLLQFDSFGFRVQLDVEQHDEDHDVELSVRDSAGDEALSAKLRFAQIVGAYTAGGDVSMNLVSLSPLLETAGLLPEGVAMLEADPAGTMNFHVPDDVSKPVTVASLLRTGSDASVRYDFDDQPELLLQLSIPQPVELGFEYPSLTWTVQTQLADIVVGSDEIDDVALRLTELRCDSSVRCSTLLQANAGDLSFAEWAVRDIKVSAKLEVELSDTVKLLIGDGATMAVNGISLPGYSVEDSIRVGFSSATLSVDDGAWQGDAGFSVEMPGSSLRYGDLVFSPPSIGGQLRLADETLSLNVSLSAPDGALGASIDAQHDVSSGQGRLQLSDAFLDFDSRALSAHLQQWPFVWDVVSGRWSASGNLQWRTTDAQPDYSGSLDIGVDKLSGSFDDVAFAGLDASTTVGLDSRLGYDVAESRLQLALFDIGLRLENITAIFAPDIEASSISVSEFAMSTLGGSIEADPFEYFPGKSVNRISLRPKSIQLALMMALADFEGIELSGSVSGELPLTVTDRKVTMTGGRLVSDEPGGEIRYRAAGSEGMTDQVDSQLGLVTRALSNFQYRSLTSEVNYTEAGDLMLQMRLEGVNPDMDASQPVILNLGVDNNVPQLLRSLQATRSINDILEKRVVN